MPSALPALANVSAGAAPVTTEVANDKSQLALEDMLAEIMRPMVRKWLDDNMKQALEKAVRAEVADSVRDMVSKTGGEKKS
jgi:cell pole-organizing protein PopZ